MREFLRHLFFPRESNNHRAKLLHHESLLFFITFLFISGIFIQVFKRNFSSVLGQATDISIEKLLLYTNEKREKEGLSNLVLNTELSHAASAKASDMFSKNYWAHNAPDGKTPWYFIKNSGYQYVYAGENLARGFTTSNEVVDAWIASPSHKENLVSPYYKDIGFAIVEGKLLGEDTTLVIQMFGNKTLIASQNESSLKIPTSQVSGKQTVATTPQVILNKPFIDSFLVSRNLSIGIVGLFIFVLIIDMIIIERKKIIRLVGHNLDHIIFLGGISLLIIMFAKGIVL